MALVTLNRPERLNTLNADMHRDLVACWRRRAINNNPAIRRSGHRQGAILLRGPDIKEYMDHYGADREPDVLRPIDNPDSPLFGCTPTTTSSRSR